MSMSIKLKKAYDKYEEQKEIVYKRIEKLELINNCIKDGILRIDSTVEYKDIKGFMDIVTHIKSLLHEFSMYLYILENAFRYMIDYWKEVEKIDKEELERERQQKKKEVEKQ